MVVMPLEAPKNERERELLAISLGQIFKPSTAIDQEDLFCGRIPQIRSVVDAINQSGRHVILYGEPGVGKTSLASILATRITCKRPIISPHINCDSSDTFQSIWSKVFSEIQVTSEKKQIGFAPEAKKEGTNLMNLIDGDVSPDAVRRALHQVGENTLLYVILDEFDKIPNSSVRNLIADTIKVLSDRSVPATIILVGVSDDVNGLIANHQSVERCLEQVHMLRMSREELEQIVAGGLGKCGMTIDATALNEITGLSKGLPHYAHLLALHSGRRALDSGSLEVLQPHVKAALLESINKTQESIRNLYFKATYSTKPKALYKQVLLACAMADTDEWGNFAPVSVSEPMTKIMGKRYSTENFAKHIHAFCEAEHGPVLKKTGDEFRYRYRFINPIVQPFVIMKGLSEALISEADLKLQYDAEGQGRLPLSG